MVIGSSPIVGIFMLQIGTIIEIKDNSGIKLGKCIKIYKNKLYGKIGDVCLISVKTFRKSKLKHLYKKGDLIKVLIITTKYNNKNIVNSFVSFSSNIGIILNDKLKSNRLNIIIPSILRHQKKLKVLLISSNIL